MSTVNIEIGLRLKVARKAAGYKTALNFATKINMPKSTYSQHENGKRGLTAEQIIYYAEKLDIQPSWLLTGLGHPCPLGKNKVQRKNKIEYEISILQELHSLPAIKNPHIEVNDSSAVVNMELFSKIIISAIRALGSNTLQIEPYELIAFCTDVYNNIEFLATSSDEKNKIIELSVNSMLRGNHIFLKKVINF